MQSLNGTVFTVAKCHAALPEPHVACNLFVPSACCGLIPRLNRTGSVISPPPPAIESTNPATTPVPRRRGNCQDATIGTMLKRDTLRLKTKEKTEFCPYTLCVAYATQSV